MPDPIIVPGTLVLSLTMENSYTLYQPISLDYKIEKLVGDEWIALPCSVTSDSACSIDDICQPLLDLPPCPKQVEQMIPCQCPLQKNNYTLDATQIPLFMSGALAAGRYKARVKANNWMYGEVLCYDINAEIVSADQLNQ
ncbi:Ganglioside GM2 activator [Bulinus truncatus]|nr:Ganglioside GM2 activator [Bulinus truncatus]